MMLRALTRICGFVVLGVLPSATASAQEATAAPRVRPGAEAVRPGAQRSADRQRPADSPLDRPVALTLADIRLDAAIDSIAARAGIAIVYTDRVVPVARRFSGELRGTVREVLARLLAGVNVRAEVTSDGGVMLVKAQHSARADTARGGVLGRVVDSATSRPIGGVEVFLRATPHAATTNADGVYYLRNVPTGTYTLVARLLGYTPVTQEVAVVDSLPVRVDLVLRPMPTRLTEIVTTVTGERRRLELGNDITVIRADSIVATQPITSVTDLLEGRVPGLVIYRSSGAPGDPSRIRIRGSSSAYLSNDPIVIVDGVRIYAPQSDARNANLAAESYAAPLPIDQIDPHSIETIEVIKGPSAATLYGQDAANGVIVITTKKGRAGPPRWRVNMEYGTRYIPGRYPDAFMRWGHTAWDGSPQYCPLAATNCIADSLVRFQALNDDDLTILDRGHRAGITVGMDGGSDALTYSLTASVADEVGLVRLPELEIQRYQALRGTAPPDWMVRPQQLTQWNLASRVTARLGSKADLSLTSMLGRSDQRRSSLERQLGELMMTYVDRASGTYYRPTLSGRIEVAPAGLQAFYQRITAGALQFTNGLNVTWRPLSWLTASADGGLHVVQRNDALLQPRGAQLDWTDSVGLAHQGQGRSVQATLNLRGTATVPLARDLQLRASVGLNYLSERTADLVVQARDLPPGGTSITGAGEIQRASAMEAERQTFGVYVEPAIAFKRLWISTALRFDGGNTFGARTELVGLPKISASYLISEEPFFPLKGIFNNLRLRAAYGHAGVQPGPGDRLRLYSTPTNLWIDGRFVPAVTLQELGNTELKPERSTEIEGGFDADLFDDRLSIGFTAYDKTRVDALMSVELPPSVYGGESVLRNVGKIRNRGVELMVGVTPLRTAQLEWSSTVQVSHNRNTVVELGPGVEPFYVGLTDRVVAGYPLGGRWGVPVLGYSDLDGDGILRGNEVVYGDTAVYLGTPAPDYSASLHTTLSMFRGSLSVSAGFTYEDGMAQQGPWTRMRPVLQAANDPSTPLGEQAAVVSSRASDFLSTETVNALRFNSLAVQYRVPSRVARLLGTRALSVTIQGTNLGLRTNYRGKDPNVNGVAIGNELRDTGVLPQPRSWSVRVSASY